MIKLLMFCTMLALMAQGCGKAPASADDTTSSTMPSKISTDAQ